MKEEPPAETAVNRWIDVGYYISGPQDLYLLNGGPRGFKSYIGKWVGDVDSDGCIAEFGVYAMHPAGYAVGTAGWSNCGGGANVIWSNKSGEWKPIFSLQDLAACRDLVAAGVPEDSGHIECYDGDDIWWY